MGTERWRVGRKVGRTVYRQFADEPSDEDQMIGVMDTPQLAQLVVDAVNAELPKPYIDAARKHELRELVFHEIVRTAGNNPAFKAVCDQMGFFSFMRLVDGVVDSIMTSQDALVDDAP